MAIHIIAAMTSNNVIGSKGKLPWSIPEETKLFRELTKGNTVIMGRNTWESLPEKYRPLPNRNNIIVSTTMQAQQGAIVCKTIQEAIHKSHEFHREIYCIGGAKLYSAMLPMADILCISWIKKQYQGDTYFPKVNFGEWNLEETKEFNDFIYKKYNRRY